MLAVIALCSLAAPPLVAGERAVDLPRLSGPETTLWVRELVTAPRACLAFLDRETVTYQPIPDQPIERGCGYADAVETAGPGVPLVPGPVAMTCPLAAALLLFEREVLQPEAERFLRSRVTAIEHYGTFQCRDIRHTGDNRRSEHARANAIDIAAFVLADGRRVTVAGDWPARGPTGRFLRAVRDGACTIFPVVLSPVWSDDHRDHFHVDIGPFRECR